MTLEYFLKSMSIALIATIILETLTAFILGVRNKKDYLNIILVNIMTNPVVNITPSIFLLYFGLFGYNLSIIVLEIIVFLLEGFIYTKTLEYKKINGYILSLILNCASYFIFYIICLFI